MAVELPQELLTEILSRLPVRTLLRFRMVSRSWNALITSQMFVALHMSRSVEANNPLILLRHFITPCINLFPCMLFSTVYRDDGESLTKDQELEFPVKLEEENYHYIGACNGLVCFSCRCRKHIILWNPSIRTYFKVPIVKRFNYSVMSCSLTVGIGFDRVTSQFKVVKLIYAIAQSRYERLIQPKVEVFVLGTNRWRRVNTDVPFVVWMHSSQAFLHGAVHWIGWRSDNSIVIVVFDVHEEVFREIEVPGSIAHLREEKFSLTTYKDSACLLVLESGSWRMKLSGVLSIWVMKQYGAKESWTKLFSIDMMDQRGFTRILGFRKCGKMFIVKDEEDLVSYDPEMESTTVEQLGLVSIPQQAIPLVESLILLKGRRWLRRTNERLQFNRRLRFYQ